MPGPMGGGPGGHRTTAKAKDFKGTTKKLIKGYLGKYKIKLLIVAIFAIASTIFTIVGPKVLGNATTEIYNGIISKISGGRGIDFEKLAKILLTVLSLYIISGVCSFIQGYTMSGVSQKVAYKLRQDLSIKINKLPMKYFDKKTNGEVLSIITNDIDMLGMNLSQSITQIITSVCTIIGILAMMFSINVTMTLISLLILPIASIIVSVIAKKSQKYFKKQQEYLGHVNGQVEEIYSGLTVVKAFNGEQKSINNFKVANEELAKSGWKSQFLSGLMYPLMNFLGNLGYVAVAITGGYFAIQGKISVGDIQSFISYNKQFTQPIAQIAQISGQIQTMIAAAERVFEFLEEENGNPFRLCIRLLKDWIKTGSERITFQIHRNLLADLSVTGQNQMFGIRGFLMKDELYKSFVEELYNRLDKDRYPTTIETLCYIVDMAIMILIKSMAMYYQNPSEKETIIQVLTEEMTILERGMCTQTSQQS